MTESPRRLRHWLRLARVPFTPTAFCDALACGWLALQVGVPGGAGVLGWPDYALLFAATTLLYSAGMAGNDWFDRARDVELAPLRAIPCGAISAHNAFLFWTTALVAGVVVAGTHFGWVMPLGAAAAMLFYNSFGKHQVVLGAVGMAGVRFANAGLIAGPLVFAGIAPLWVLLAPLMVGLYSAAITLMSTTEDGANLQRRWIARVLSAGVFGGAAGLAWLASGNALPTLGVLIAFGVVSSTLFGRTPRPGPPKRMVLEMLLGLYFLAYVIASAAWDGSPIVGVGGLAVALLLINVSRFMIRKLFVIRAPAQPQA